MKTRAFFVFILASIMSICCATLSYAQEPVIGLVVWVTGTIQAAMPNAPKRVLSRRSPVYEKDTISTDANSSGQIVFTDNSILSLQKGTTLQIAAFHYAKNTAGGNKETLNLIKGGFRTITGAITKENPASYKVNTPVATIGVAGTIYSAYFDNSVNNLFAKLDKGIVFISNQAGEIKLSKGPPADRSRCPFDMYAEVTVDKKPAVVCNEPTVFLNEPPLIPVAFPSSKTPGTVGSFCISKM